MSTAIATDVDGRIEALKKVGVEAVGLFDSYLLFPKPISDSYPRIPGLDFPKIIGIMHGNGEFEPRHCYEPVIARIHEQIKTELGKIQL